MSGSGDQSSYVETFVRYRIVEISAITFGDRINRYRVMEENFSR